MALKQRPDSAHFRSGQPHEPTPLNAARPKWPLMAAAAAGGAVVGAFVPMGLVESVSSAIGLTEMIPAAAPPLGGTMRALLVVGGGVSALALAAAILGPKRAAPPIRAPRPHTDPIIQDDEAGETIMGQPASAARTRMPNARGDSRQMVRDDVQNYEDEAPESGGFLSRIRQSFSKLPLPRRFEEDEAQGGPIRDFSDLKRLRPAADQGDLETGKDNNRRNVRPIAAHAELGEPLPPITPMVRDTAMVSDDGDDFAAMEHFAQIAAARAGQTAPASVPQPQSVLNQEVSTVIVPPATGPSVTVPVSDNVPPLTAHANDSIEALVERLEHALHHARKLATEASTDGAPETPELDLAQLAVEQRRAELAEEQRQADMAAEQQRAEEEQARVEAEDRRRAEILAAQEAAKIAAEAADRAADEARRRAEEAQSLLASLGVEQSAPVVQAIAPAPTPLRAVEPSAPAAAEPEMDDALRSALRTLRRMSNP